MSKENENTVSLADIAKSEDIEAFRIDHDGAVKIMANEILGLPTYVQIGHKNGNLLDNRRCNLFVIDPQKGAEND